MRTLLLFAVSAGLAAAQPASNAIEVTASRTLNPVPDQLIFNVIVTTATDAPLSNALAVVQPIGLTAADLGNVSTVSVFDFRGKETGTQVAWSFSLTVPLASLKDTTAKLQALAQKNANLVFNVARSATSPQACPNSDLIADARGRAQQLANAAGVTLGPILGMSDAGSINPIFNTIPQAVFVSLSGFLAISPPPQQCALTVKFGLLRYQ